MLNTPEGHFQSEVEKKFNFENYKTEQHTSHQNLG